MQLAGPGVSACPGRRCRSSLTAPGLDLGVDHLDTARYCGAGPCAAACLKITRMFGVLAQIEALGLELVELHQVSS
jgi:hypothetical protein